MLAIAVPAFASHIASGENTNQTQSARPYILIHQMVDGMPINRPDIARYSMEGFQLTGWLENFEDITESSKPVVFAIAGHLGNSFAANLTNHVRAEGQIIHFSGPNGFYMTIDRKRGTFTASTKEAIPASVEGIYFRVGKSSACVTLKFTKADTHERALKEHIMPERCPEIKGPIPEIWEQEEGLELGQFPAGEPLTHTFYVQIDESAGIDPEQLYLVEVDDGYNRVGQPLCKLRPGFTNPAANARYRHVPGDGLYSCDATILSTNRARGIAIGVEAQINGKTSIPPYALHYDVVQRFSNIAIELPGLGRAQREVDDLWESTETGGAQLRAKAIDIIRSVPGVLDVREDPDVPGRMKIHISTGQSITYRLPKSKDEAESPHSTHSNHYVEPKHPYLWLLAVVGTFFGILIGVGIGLDKLAGKIWPDSLNKKTEFGQPKRICIGIVGACISFWTLFLIFKMIDMRGVYLLLSRPNFRSTTPRDYAYLWVIYLISASFLSFPISKKIRPYLDTWSYLFPLTIVAVILIGLVLIDPIHRIIWGFFEYH